MPRKSPTRSRWPVHEAHPRPKVSWGSRFASLPNKRSSKSDSATPLLLLARTTACIRRRDVCGYHLFGALRSAPATLSPPPVPPCMQTPCISMMPTGRPNWGGPSKEAMASPASARAARAQDDQQRAPRGRIARADEYGRAQGPKWRCDKKVKDGEVKGPGVKDRQGHPRQCGDG